MPKGVTWRDAQTTEDAVFGIDEAWEHPLADAVAFPEPETTVSYVAHARWVAAFEPRPAQALVTAVERSVEGECGAESHRATLGWWRDDAFESIDIDVLDASDPPLLVGAIGWGTETVALVFDDGLDGMLAILGAGEDGPTWTVQPLVAGQWSASDRASAALRVQTCG